MACPDTPHSVASTCKENQYFISKSWDYFKIILKLGKNKTFTLTERYYKSKGAARMKNEDLLVSLLSSSNSPMPC